MQEISKRLLTIANYVNPGSRVADIGSDHAYLPVFLIQAGKAVSAIAGEVNQGPWTSAVQHVKEAGLSERIDVRLGDGLSVVENGEVDTICIAGMGGALICQILEAGIKRLSSVSHLILQPNVAEKNVRKWLYQNGWELKGESILKEDGILYEVLSVTRGNPEAPYIHKDWSLDAWFELGPFLWQERSPVYKEKWQEESKKVERVLNSLEQSSSSEALAKKEEMANRLEWIKEVQKCLQTDKP